MLLCIKKCGKHAELRSNYCADCNPIHEYRRQRAEERRKEDRKAYFAFVVIGLLMTFQLLFVLYMAVGKTCS